MTQPSGFEIAIIGMAGRFPGAPDVAAFWRNLRAGVESVTRFSEAQLRARGVSAELLADPSYVRAGIVLEGMDQFDAELFEYSAREALYLDPQQRLFLECAWEALEHAGYLAPVDVPQPPIGVYAGEGANLYLLRHVLPTAGQSVDIADLLALSNGSSPGSLCTRVAYKLNLRGPALSLQTECSTSLVAVHVACSALLGQECDVALAGGVWLNLLQEVGYRHQAGAILAPDGHCRAFDASADGTLLGSGVGVVVLKRLSEALRDGDTIQAVIKGSAINNDGADKIGFTAPSVNGQVEVIRAAQAMAEIAPQTIGYVEAHGTGTRLGDPIEIAALNEVFGSNAAPRASCALGSVKTNIGHLDAAAGVAGLIKTVLSLQHATLLPSLNFEAPNPKIDFAAGPFYVNTQTQPWPAASTPRRAAVSSFGIGGTNAHVVLEESPSAAVNRDQAGVHLLRLAARNAVALSVQVQQLAEHLEQHPELALADADFTLRVGRRRFAERAVVVGRTHGELLHGLRERSSAQYLGGCAGSQRPRVAMVFSPPAVAGLPGEVLQHACLREAVRQCERALPGAVQHVPGFVIQYAVAQEWLRRGVVPDALLGRGQGSYVAACIAGVLPLEQALRLAGDPASVTPATLQLSVPLIPLVSTPSGTWLTHSEALQPRYWIEQARSDAAWATALATLLEPPDRLLLELGSDEVLRAHAGADVLRMIALRAQTADLELELARCVAQLWVAGVEASHDQPVRRRIPLPTYPFQRQSYWLGMTSQPEQRDLGDWGYVPSWRRVAAPESMPSQPAGCTLVLGGANPFTQRLLEHLRSRGARVAHAQPGATFAALGDHSYALRPAERDDHELLLQQVAIDLAPVTHICHLLSLESGAAVEPLSDGFFSLLALGQALHGSLEGTHEVVLTVVSNGLEDVSGLDPLHPVKAALYGPCRVLPLELERVTCRVIDLADLSNPARAVGQLAACIYTPSAAAVMALRGARAWVKEYQPQRLQSHQPRLRRGGVYVITGGLGGIGAVLGRYLRTTWDAHVVVISRTVGSARAKLESGGAELGLQADVSDPSALAAALRTVRERFGAVNGVIHAAGVAGGGLMALRSRAAIDAVFAPKITGTQTLLQALSNDSPDFILLCSSLTALTGDIGQVDYCAANCVLDALAAQAAQRGSTWVAALNWDLWRDTGMASSLEFGAGMASEQGVEIFARVLSGPRLPQLIVSTLELERQFAHSIRNAAAHLPREMLTTCPQHPRPELATAYVTPAEGLEQSLASLWSEFLGVAPIGAQDDLFELGGDSLLALQLLSRVQSAYAVELPPAELLRTPTIAALAELIELRLIEQIEQAAPEQPVRAAG